MIRKWICIGVTLMMLAVAAAEAVGQAASSNVPNFYYGWRGAKTSVQMSRGKIAVRFEKGLERGQKEAILRGESDLAPSAAQLQPERLERARNMVVNVAAGRSRAQVLGRIQSLNARAGVEHSSPVFDTRSGDEEALTDMFYANFRASTPESQIQALHARHGVEIIDRVDLNLIGKVGYWLRVPKGSGRNALELANLYYEDPLTLEAAPAFWHLYRVLQGNPPDDPEYDDEKGALHRTGSSEPYDAEWQGNESYPIKQWNLEQINAQEAWDEVYNTTTTPWTAKNGQDVTIASLDSGVDLEHEDLDVGSKILDGYDFVAHFENDHSQGCEVAGCYDPQDPLGHGTAVIGIAAAATNNNRGIAGICSHAKILPVRIHNATGKWDDDAEDWEIPPDYIDYPDSTGGGYGYDRYCAHGLLYAAGCEPYDGFPPNDLPDPAHVFCCSLAVSNYNPALRDAVHEARAQGCVMVCALGCREENLDENPRFPGYLPEMICVGAANYDADGVGEEYPKRVHVKVGEEREDDVSLTWFASPWGSALDVVAPSQSFLELVGEEYRGLRTRSTKLDDDYGWPGGQCSAVSQVAGVAALVLTVKPELCPAEVQSIIQFTADDIERDVQTGEETLPPRDIYTGYGQIDAYEAVKLAKAGRMRILANDGHHLASFDANGNFVLGGCGVLDEQENYVLEGTLTEGATSGQLEPTSDSEFLVRDSSADEIVRLTEGADMYLAGEIIPGQSSLNPPTGSFIIRNNAGNAVAYIDQGGDLYLKGQFFDGGNPDPDAKRMEELIVEDFEAYDCDDLLAGDWILSGGDWYVECDENDDDNRYLTDTGLSPELQHEYSGWETDIEQTFRYRFADSGTRSLSVYMRYENSNNNARVKITPDDMWVLEEVGGQSTALFFDNYATSEVDTWYRVFVRCIGDDVEVWRRVDEPGEVWDVIVESGTCTLDESIDTTDRFRLSAIGNSNVWIDDIVVWSQ